MVTFFSILLTLLVINVVLLLVSVNKPAPKQRSLSRSTSNPVHTEVYPLDIVLSKYKKAV
jgi:hypothetical protein